MLNKGLFALLFTLFIFSSCSMGLRTTDVINNEVDGGGGGDGNGGGNVVITALGIQGSVSGLTFTRNYSFEPAVLSQVRFMHTSTLLQDGRVINIGGIYNGNTTNTAELYDPASEGSVFTSGALSGVRLGHTATLLNSGRVLVVGGTTGLNLTTVVELYNPITDSFTIHSSLNVPRGDHTTTLLNDGKVLIVGGSNGVDLLDSIEIYDPQTGLFSELPSGLNTARYGHTATLLNDGKVLIVGGSINLDGLDDATASVELFDPASGLVTELTGLNVERKGHTATLLNDGSVLVVGGMSNEDIGGFANILNTAELYNPDTKDFTSLVNTLQDARFFHTANILDEGTVLLIGGEGSGASDSLFTAELYDPLTQSFSTIPQTLAVKRTQHTATRLTDGRILVVGNGDWEAPLETAGEIYGYTSAQAYQAQFTASGGVTPYIYSVVSGGGFINPYTGLYNALGATSNTIVVSVEDAVGDLATVELNLTITE